MRLSQIRFRRSRFSEDWLVAGVTRLECSGGVDETIELDIGEPSRLLGLLILDNIDILDVSEATEILLDIILHFVFRNYNE